MNPEASRDDTSTQGGKEETLVPRVYQMEMVELAKNSNTVAYLDTGSGKTFIAVCLLRHRLDAYRIAASEMGGTFSRDTSNSRGRTEKRWMAAFLAPQVALVEQQAVVLARHLPARVRKFTGVDIDRWTTASYVPNWRRALEDLDVLVATPQVLFDMLCRGVLEAGIAAFDLLVFDEAHHCKGGHPFNKIMSLYRELDKSRSRPLVFGMSAAPAAGGGKATSARVLTSLAQLQANMEARVVTVADRTELEAVVPQPEMEVVRFAPENSYEKQKKLKESIEQATERLQEAMAGVEEYWKKQVEAQFESVATISPWYDDLLTVTFEPGAPRFKITRFKDVLRSVVHVLQNVGVYGAALAALDVFKWLNVGAPDPRADAYTRGPQSFLSTSAEAKAMEGSDDLTAAAVSAAVDVVGGFANVFCAPFAGCQDSATVALRTDALLAVEAVILAARERRPLRDAACRAMLAMLKLVDPSDLRTWTNPSIAGDLVHNSNKEEEGPSSTFPFGCPLVTPKIQSLFRVLHRYRESGDPKHWSAIVFAQQRLAVHAIVGVLQAASGSLGDDLRAHAFMAQGAAFGGISYHPREQRAILDDFRSGAINVLVSTSVAEEGIDVKGCQLVVRFDPATTAQAFHQSRGRARAIGSHMVALVEAGDAAAEATVDGMVRYQAHLRQVALANVHRLGNEEEDGEEYAAALREEDGGDAIDTEGLLVGANTTYTVPATGARVTLQTALGLLQLYVSKLPCDQYMLMRPSWRFETLENVVVPAVNRVRATVHLPAASPVSVAVGMPSPNKGVAKAMAALEACRELHKQGALNDYLLPAELQGDSEDDDSEAEEGEVQGGGRKSRPKVEIVTLQFEQPAAMKAPLVLQEERCREATLSCYGWRDASGHHHQDVWLPIALLLSNPLDLSSAFSKEPWVPIRMQEAQHIGDVTVDPVQFRLIMRCSEVLRAMAGAWCALPNCQAVNEENTVEGAPTYALVPVRLGGPSVAFDLDWQLIKQVDQLKRMEDAGLSALDFLRASGDVEMEDVLGKGGRARCDALQYKLLSTKYNRMQYICTGVAEDLVVDSEFPKEDPTKDAEDGKFSWRRGGRGLFNAADSIDEPPKTFREYYEKRWNITDLDPNQPLLLAMRSSTKNVAGVAADKAERGDPAVNQAEAPLYLVPQLCTIHPIPAPLHSLLSKVPEMLWVLQSSLVAEELLAELQLDGLPAAVCPPPTLLCRALTAPSARSAIGDYETLESLGDGVLKYATAVQLFVAHPGWHEGQLTQGKDRIVSNTRLLSIAFRLGLQKRMRVANWGWRSRSRPRRGLPTTEEGGKTNESTIDNGYKEEVSRNSKILSDGVEAILGAFYVGGGEGAAFAFLHHLGLFNVSLQGLPDVAVPAPPDGLKCPAVDIEAIQKTLGYTFNRPWLVQEALTHGSVLGWRCYQRLEFLGDAVLDVCLMTHAYSRNSNITPAEMHDTKSVALNFERLALTVIRHRLHTHILHHSPILFRLIDEFVEETNRSLDIVREDLRCDHHYDNDGEIANEDDCWDAVLHRWPFGLDQMASPKVLSDVFESLIGAVWLDAGGDSKVAWRVASRLLAPLPGEDGRPLARHPTRMVHEMAAAQHSIATFERIEGSDMDIDGGFAVRVMIGGRCIGQGPPSHNLTTASRLAAQAALKETKRNDKTSWHRHSASTFCKDLQSSELRGMDAATSQTEDMLVQHELETLFYRKLREHVHLQIGHIMRNP